MGWHSFQVESEQRQFDVECVKEQLRLAREANKKSKRSLWVNIATLIVAILTLGATIYFGMK